MLEVWRRAEQGQPVAIPDDSWAHMIRKFRHLKTFTLEFETSKEKEGELKAIIAQAQNWSFPLVGGSCSLKAARQPDWHYWRGPKCLDTLAREGEPNGPELVVAKVFYQVTT